jgi:hypothetical protein
MWLLDHLWPGRRPFLPGRGRAAGAATPALAETPCAGGRSGMAPWQKVATPPRRTRH